MPAPPVTIVEGNLLDQDVDVIVNAWNRNVIPWWLLLPQGVSGAIKRRAGYASFRELARHGPIPLGGAVLTSAGSGGFRPDRALALIEDELNNVSSEAQVTLVIFKRA
jgi:O-acetyl-ADP-ribose deacetylase (regulator of RNase III)